MAKKKSDLAHFNALDAIPKAGDEPLCASNILKKSEPPRLGQKQFMLMINDLCERKDIEVSKSADGWQLFRWAPVRRRVECEPQPELASRCGI